MAPLTREEHLRFCKRCKHQMFDLDRGIICGLTAKIADFEGDCEDYQGDPAKLLQVAKAEANKEIEGKLASKGLRLLNYLLDLAFAAIFTFILAFYLGLLIGIFAPELLDTIDFESFILNVFLSVGFGVLYFSIMEFTTGRTLAKFITCTKVKTINGDKPSFSAILTRSFVRYVPFEPLSFLMSDQPGWHDGLSDTVVVMDNPYKRKKIL